MILVICLKCELAIRIMPAQVLLPSSVQELEQLVGRRSEFWPNRYPCPKCEGVCTAILDTQADPQVMALLTVQDLTPQEAFSAFMGCGFPEEQSCSLERVQELLKQPVKQVIGTNVPGVERTLVDALELEDGTKLHFGASSDGAVIYRITKPISYTKMALEEACPSP